jgi:hypothetical protein
MTRDRIVVILDGTRNRPLGRQLFVEEETPRSIPATPEPSRREPYSWRTRTRLFARQAARDRQFYGGEPS